MKKIFVVFALLSTIALMISCGGSSKPADGGNSENSSEADDYSEPTDPKEIRVSECTGLPEHAQWNTVSEIKQKWDGRSWQPPKEGNYNETPSETECRFVCKENYTWNGSACIVGCTTDSVPPTLPECSEQSGTPCEDSSTGLIWSSSGYDLYSWDAKLYCRDLKLEGGVCGGWRLPNINELRTLIIRCSGTMPEGSCAVKDPDCLSKEECWSDDCYCEGTGGGFFSKLGNTGTFLSSSYFSHRYWIVNFYNGRVDLSDDLSSSKYDVRCVRKKGLPICSVTSGTPCEDSSTGLTWSAKASNKMAWQDAIDYCIRYSESGLVGWHLPNIDELMKNNNFGDIGSFWSSSPHSDYTDFAWDVDFKQEGMNKSFSDKSVKFYVRCVR